MIEATNIAIYMGDKSRPTAMCAHVHGCRVEISTVVVYVLSY